MKSLLKDCPRHYIPEDGVQIKASQLRDKKGREVVNCRVCFLSNSRGRCKLVNAAMKMARLI